MAKLRWWQTYDYLTGNSYILGQKFAEKGQAIGYARGCGMAVIAQSTRSLTDEERALKLKGGEKNVTCRGNDKVQSQEQAHTKRPCTGCWDYGADCMQY